VNALRENDLDLALVRFNIALRLAPIYAPVYGNVGVVRRRMGDTQGAFDYYLLALLLEPHNSSIRNNMFQTLEEYSGHAAAAFRETEAGSADFEARKFMARAAEKLVESEVRDALSLYRRAHKKQPDWIDPIVGMARCELLLGRPPAARKQLEEALVMDPENPSARRLTVAIDRIFEKQGRHPRKKDDIGVVQPEPSWKPGERGPGPGDPL